MFAYSDAVVTIDRINDIASFIGKKFYYNVSRSSYNRILKLLENVKNKVVTIKETDKFSFYYIERR